MKKILIVEDDPDILEALKMVLTGNGYDIRVTHKGNEVYGKAHDYQPDLIIVDYLVSGADGVTISRELRQSPAIGKVPIVMMSAHPHAGQIARKAGIDHFLAKPFTLQQLLDQVEQLIK